MGTGARPPTHSDLFVSFTPTLLLSFLSSISLVPFGSRQTVVSNNLILVLSRSQEEEAEQHENLMSTLRLKELERRGLVILNVRVVGQKVGYFGKTILKVGPAEKGGDIGGKQGQSHQKKNSGAKGKQSQKKTQGRKEGKGGRESGAGARMQDGERPTLPSHLFRPGDRACVLPQALWAQIGGAMKTSREQGEVMQGEGMMAMMMALRKKGEPLVEGVVSKTSRGGNGSNCITTCE